MKNHKSITAPWQSSFEDLGRSLRQTNFVVLDLETSGGSPNLGSVITEIGAVKVRGGEVIGHFQTLINIGQPLPPFITVLTGITDAMLIQAPPIEEAFPALLEFLGSPDETVFVAHNAPFDLGFLKSTAKTLNYLWPHFPVIDTARIARQVLNKEEAPNVKLGTLAKIFSSDTSPNHRALDDARATVDVLHGILERLGNLGISTIEDLATFSHRITDSQRSKRHLTEGIPPLPGVYIFRGKGGKALYVGTSKNLKSRVRSYFTAQENRKRILQMIDLVERVDHIVCATNLEAQIRELRLILQEDPPFNKKSRRQNRVLWVGLTDENFPRLSTLRKTSSLSDERGWMGPFHRKEQAQLAIDAIFDFLSIRQCTIRISDKTIKENSPCALYDMKRCNAPCIGAESHSSYAITAAKAHHLMSIDPTDIHRQLTLKMKKLSLEERFEEAQEINDRLTSLIDATSRAQRIRSLTNIRELITALPLQEGDGYEFICIRYGRFAGSAKSTRGISFQETIKTLQLTSEIVEESSDVLPASTYEEVEKLLGYVESSGIRLVHIDGIWAIPINGSEKFRTSLKAQEARYEADNLWLNSTQRSRR